MSKNVNSHLSNLKDISTPLLVDTTQIVFQKKHRCQHCDKLLGIEQLNLPAFDIKCVRCGHINSIVKDYERQVIITDKDGIILYVNEQVIAATGYSPKEILGKTPAVWGGQMSKEFYKNMWDEIAKKKKAIVVKATNKHKNGQLYPVILRISPILDINGNVELFIGMETITENTSNHTIK